MVTKNCPKCSSQVPVACKKCSCGHSFFTPRKGFGASGSGQSGCGGASSSIQESIDQRLESMTMDEYESFLNVCITPNSLSKTEEQAEMISQLDRPSKLQPEEQQIPPLKNAKYSSSLQSLNNGKGSSSVSGNGNKSVCACAPVPASALASASAVTLAAVAVAVSPSLVTRNCTTTTHIPSQDGVGGLSLQHSDTSNTLPDTTFTSSSSLHKDNDSCAPPSDGCSSSGGGGDVSNCRDQHCQNSSQKNQHSHCGSSISSASSNSSSDSTSISIPSNRLSSNYVNNKENECADDGDNAATADDNDSSLTSAIDSLQNLVISQDSSSQGKADDDPSTSTSDSDGRCFPRSKSPILFPPAPPIPQDLDLVPEEPLGKLDSKYGEQKSPGPDECVLGLPSVFSPTSSIAGDETSPKPSKDSPTGSTSSSTKTPFESPSGNELSYTLPYFFNGREDNGPDCASRMTELSSGGSDAAAGEDGERRRNLAGTSGGSGSGYSSTSNYATVTEFVRAATSQGTRNPQYMRDDDKSQNLSKSSSYRDLNNASDSIRSITPTTFTIKSLDNSVPTAASTSSTAGKTGKRANKKDKSEKGVTTTSDQIQGFRGSEDVDQLVKFIEGEKAQTQEQKKKGKPPKKDPERSKGKEKDVLVKSVSLDDDNLTAVNVKPNLERSSSSALVEKNTPEKGDNKDQPSTKEEKPKSTTSKEQSVEGTKEEKPSIKEVKPNTKEEKPNIKEEKPSTREEKASIKEEEAPSALLPAKTVEPPTPSGQDKTLDTSSAPASLDSPSGGSTLTGRSSPDYFDALDTLDVAQNTVKEEYTVVSRKKKKKPEQRDTSFNKARDQYRGRPDRTRSRPGYANSDVDRRKSVGSVPGSEHGSGSDDDSVRSLPSSKVSHSQNVPKLNQSPSASTKQVTPPVKPIDEKIVQKVDQKKPEPPLPDNKVAKTAAPAESGPLKHPPPPRKNKTEETAKQQDKVRTVAAEKSEKEDGAKPVVAEQKSEREEKTRARLPKAEQKFEKTEGKITSDSVQKPQVKSETAKTSWAKKTAGEGAQQTKKPKEPVIFCGENFKKQPKAINPDIEFGFGVNDFIDSTKTTQQKQEKPEKVKVPERSEAQKESEAAPTTNASGTVSCEVVNERESRRNSVERKNSVDQKQHDQSSESGVSAEEKEEVCVEPASDQETQDGGSRTPDHETSEESVGTPSGRNCPMRTPQRQVSSTESYPQMYEPLSIQPSMNHCVNQVTMPSPQYPPPTSLQYYPHTQSFHPSIYAISNPMAQILPPNTYLPGTGMSSPPIYVNMNLLSPSQVATPTGQTFTNVPAGAIIPNMTTQHINLQPHYGQAVNHFNLSPLLLQQQQQQQHQQQQLQQQQIQQQQMQQQQYQQQFQQQLYHQQQQQQQQQYNNKSPASPIVGHAGHPDILTPQQIQQLQVLSQSYAQTAHILNHPVRNVQPSPQAQMTAAQQFYQSPFVYKVPQGDQQAYNERGNMGEREPRPRGGMSGRRGNSRTYYNSERERPRYGANTNHNYGGHQYRDNYNPTSRRGSKHSVQSPINNSPPVGGSPNVEASQSRPLSTASSQQGPPEHEKDKCEVNQGKDRGQGARSEDVGRKKEAQDTKQGPGTSKNTDNDSKTVQPMPDADQSEAEAEAKESSGFTITGQEIADRFQHLELDPASADAALAAVTYMNNYVEKAVREEKKGKRKIKHL